MLHWVLRIEEEGGSLGDPFSDGCAFSHWLQIKVKGASGLDPMLPWQIFSFLAERYLLLRNYMFVEEEGEI